MFRDNLDILGSVNPHKINIPLPHLNGYKGRKELIFSMFRKNKTVDEILNFIDFERTKILEYKKEYDQINAKL